MKSSKTTRRALLGSLTSLLLCFAMLIGSTFAWFTDTASTSVNKIEAGTLKVELQMKDANGSWVSAEGKTLSFKTADNRTENIYWEPGCTYETEEIRIVNMGNLALKYQILVSGINGDAKLNEAIEWEVQMGAAYPDLNNGQIKWSGQWSDIENLASIEDDAVGKLYPSDQATQTNAHANAAYLKIRGTMGTTAGNEYQGLKIENIAITVIAKQFNHEYDSNGNTYDETAEYPTAVSSVAALKDAISGTTTVETNVALTNDLTFKPDEAANVGNSGTNINKNHGQAFLLVKKSIDIDLNGQTISGSGEYTNLKEGILASGSDVTVNVYDSSADKTGSVVMSGGACALYVEDGATMNVYGGTYSSPNPVVAVAQYGGTLNIYGGTYKSTCDTNNQYYAAVAKLLLNGVENETPANQITVYGGSFVGFDPSSAGSNVTVADGYKVVTTTEDGNTIYTVVPQ